MTTPQPARARLLFVRLRGAVAAVEAACTRMLADAAAATRMDNAQAGPDWAACRDQSLPFFHACRRTTLALWRLSCRRPRRSLALPCAQLIEWHGGLRWLWAPPRPPAQLRAGGRPSGRKRYCFS